MANFLIKDDHAIVRTGVKAVIEDFFKPCSISEALMKNQPALNFQRGRFGVIIMDVQMPGTDSLSLMEYIHSE